MTTYYRSPRSGSVAAATTPARLAQEYDNVLWRSLPDGGIEVAIQHEDRFEHLRVHDDGSTSQLASVALRSSEWAKLLGLLSVSLIITGWVGLVVWDAATGTFDNAMLMVFLAGMALGVVTSVAYWVVSDDWRSPLGSGWHTPTNLNGWTPRTSAQLGAVEAIADRHGGRALVRDIGAATIDVCAKYLGGLEHYIVDDDGFSIKRTEQALGSLTTPRNWLRSPPLAIVFVGPPLLAAHFGEVWKALGLMIGIAATVWVWRRLPMQQLKRGSDGTRWIEVRTQEPDPD